MTKKNSHGYTIKDWISLIEQNRFDKVSNSTIQQLVVEIKELYAKNEIPVIKDYSKLKLLSSNNNIHKYYIENEPFVLIFIKLGFDDGEYMVVYEDAYTVVRSRTMYESEIINIYGIDFNNIKIDTNKDNRSEFKKSIGFTMSVVSLWISSIFLICLFFNKNTIFIRPIIEIFSFLYILVILSIIRFKQNKNE